jgi:hypothetical protein
MFRPSLEPTPSIKCTAGVNRPERDDDHSQSSNDKVKMRGVLSSLLHTSVRRGEKVQRRLFLFLASATGRNRTTFDPSDIIPSAPTEILLPSRPGQSMWDLWWTKWHWAMFFSEFFGFPLSISFHRRSPNSYHLENVLYANVSRHPRLGTRLAPSLGKETLLDTAHCLTRILYTRRFGRVLFPHSCDW